MRTTSPACAHARHYARIHSFCPSFNAVQLNFDQQKSQAWPHGGSRIKLCFDRPHLTFNFSLLKMKSGLPFIYSHISSTRLTQRSALSLHVLMGQHLVAHVLQYAHQLITLSASWHGMIVRSLTSSLVRVNQCNNCLGAGRQISSKVNHRGDRVRGFWELYLFR